MPKRVKLSKDRVVKALAKGITLLKTSEILHVSVPTLKQFLDKYEQKGQPLYTRKHKYDEWLEPAKLEIFMEAVLRLQNLQKIELELGLPPYAVHYILDTKPELWARVWFVHGRPSKTVIPLRTGSPGGDPNWWREGDPKP